MSDKIERARLAMERGAVSDLELTDEDLAGLTAAQTMSTHRKAAFLRAFAMRGIVLDGAKAAGVSRKSISYWRKEDEWFEELYLAALEEAGDRVEGEVFRRAVEGVDEVVLFQGYPTTIVDKETGEERMLTVKKYSDSLAAILLKGHKQEKYRENVKAVHDFGGQTGVLIVPSALDADSWAKAAREQQAQFAGNVGEASEVAK